MTAVNYQLNQRAYYNGEEVTLKSYDQFSGKCTIVIDGEIKIVDKNDLFGRNAQIETALNTNVEVAKSNLEKLKENFNFHCNLFDIALAGVKEKRKEIDFFQREYGTNIDNMSSEQRNKYMTLLAERSDFSSMKNRALGDVLNGSNQVGNAARYLQTQLSQVSIYNAMMG